MNALLNFASSIFTQGRFHHNKVNKIIHFIFIPIIQFTLFILGASHWHSIKIELFEWIVPDGNICVETWALFVAVMTYYIAADMRTASVTFLWSGLQLIASQYIAIMNDVNITLPWNENTEYKIRDIVLYLHITAWLAQFYGHGVHEGRAPALTTNLLFALLAPFFVTFEFLNGVFGYKEDEMKGVRKRIEEDIDAFKREKDGKKKRT